MAAAIGGDTRFESLQYRVQAQDYGGGVGYMSFSHQNFPIGPIASPRLAYDQLFAGFTPGGGGGTPPPPSDRLLQGASVLDLVLRRSERLRQVMGASDRIRLEEHFEQIRTLENRISDIAEGGGTPTGGNGTCAVPADPGSDPTVNESVTDANGSSGWSDEDKRGIVMADLIHMAMACDLTRVASLMIGFVSSAINMKTIIGVNYDAHDTTHSTFQQSVSGQTSQLKEKVSQFFTEPFSYLMQKLHDTPEGDGNMLDHTVAVQLWEHGNPGAHNVTSYILPIVGMPSALAQGQYINGGGRHPSHVLQTAMAAIGVHEDFGGVPGLFDELLV